jgi:molecular chaperone HscB
MDTQQSPKRRELSMARSMCWHCQSEIHGEYFCQQCVKVQPLTKELDYFSCLGLSRRLNIQTDELEAKFYELSRTFHPDFFQNKTAAEQAISLRNSALLNTAYRTLKDPVQRAEYLVRLEAGSAKDIRTAPPADLFEEILSLQENLEEYRSLGSATAADRAELEGRLLAHRRTLEARQQELEGRLRELFTAWDRLQDREEQGHTVRSEKDAVLKQMQELLSHRTYLRNIVNNLVTTIGEDHVPHRRH